MTLFVFDFDGVLFDTARECLEVAYTTKRRDEPQRWPAAPDPELASAFLASRHVVGPPWQYAVLLDCLAQRRLPRTTAEFLAIARPREAQLESFTARYFATRGELAQDLDRWCSMITPFERALAVYRRLHDAGRAAILSTRDDLSIQRIVGKFAGIAPVLLPRSGAKPKWEILLEVAATRGLPPGEVWFLDDYAEHAVPARNRGVAAQLALWGYLGPDDIKYARGAGVHCLELEQLDDAVARHERR